MSYTNDHKQGESHETLRRNHFVLHGQTGGRGRGPRCLPGLGRINRVTRTVFDHFTEEMGTGVANVVRLPKPWSTCSPSKSMTAGGRQTTGARTCGSSGTRWAAGPPCTRRTTRSTKTAREREFSRSLSFCSEVPNRAKLPSSAASPSPSEPAARRQSYCVQPGSSCARVLV